MSLFDSVMRNAYEKAGVPFDETKIHIGGDQLTRERFSSAKRLLLGTKNVSDTFDHLSPVTAEFFHLSMKLLSVCHKRLYNTNNGRDNESRARPHPKEQCEPRC